MSTILEKIADIENEMARTQKNKATASHLGMLKAKLAKLRLLRIVITHILHFFLCSLSKSTDGNKEGSSEHRLEG